MPPKKSPVAAMSTTTDLPLQAIDVWDVAKAEPRSEFIKRVATDILRIAAAEQKGYAKSDISSASHARAVELADLLGLKD